MSGTSTSTAPSRKRALRRLSNVLSYAICGVVALITATPFIWMALGSLKNATEVVEYPPTFFPREFAWNNYVEVFTSVPFLRYIFNSFLVASTVTLVALLFHSMAYATPDDAFSS
jgi:multiple sugar transport system permease protein